MVFHWQLLNSPSKGCNFDLCWRTVEKGDHCITASLAGGVPAWHHLQCVVCHWLLVNRLYCFYRSGQHDGDEWPLNSSPRKSAHWILGFFPLGTIDQLAGSNRNPIFKFLWVSGKNTHLLLHHYPNMEVLYFIIQC